MKFGGMKLWENGPDGNKIPKETPEEKAWLEKKVPEFLNGIKPKEILDKEKQNSFEETNRDE
jgi:hypothetical protein